MILREFFEAAPQGWQEVEDDQSQLHWGETRKTKLTLGMISKLRKMNDVQAYERAQDLKKIRKQYKSPAGDGAPSL
jgi:hypothetical protein